MLSTARYAADRLRNVGLPNRQKPQGMSCEAMGEFRVSVPRGGLRTASIYAFLGWDLMRPGFPMEWTPPPGGIAMCQDGTEG